MRVQLLGPIQVRDASGSLVAIHGARPRALLARLALSAGEVVPSGTLVDDLWGEAAPSTNALHTLVSRLRRDLAGATAPGGDLAAALGSHPAGYVLDLPAEQVDARQAEALAGLARSGLAAGDWALAGRSARQGLALFRDGVLSDVGDPPFAAGATASLEQLRLGLVEDLADAALSGGQPGDLAELEVVARAHPLRERLQGLLVRGLYAEGRQADALAAYERTRRQLADELGVDPSPALDQIHLAVLRQDEALLFGARAVGAGGAGAGGGGGGRAGGSAAQVPAAEPAQPAQPAEPAAGSSRNNLRAALTSFVGRDRELEQVMDAVRASRLVTLVGPGGAGKTRLALEAGHALAAELDSGVWLVELAPVHDPADLAHAVLTTLGLRERALLDRPRESLTGALEPADAMSRLLSGLAGAQMLIVLDNCEHLISAVAELADEVLAACPGVRLLTTSREPLGILGETLNPLPPLALPPAGATAEQALGYASVRLFVDRAVAVHPGFSVDPQSADAVVSIVRRLDGLPLAIELAAARTRAMSAQQIAARLDDRFRLLTGGNRTALPRHRTLLAVVEWSWDLLEKPERLLLQRLAVFAGPVTLETIEAICPDDQLPESDVLDLLATLVDKSLVEPLGAGEVRYRLLETVRAFAADRLAEADEAGPLRDRHAAYLCGLAEEADPYLRGPDELAWLARLDAVRDDLVAALRWCIDSDQADLAVRVVAALGWWLHLRGMTSEMSHWPKEALALVRDGETVDRAAQAIATTYAAMGSATEGDFTAGREQLAAAVTLAEEVKGASDHPILAMLKPGAMMFALEFEQGMAAIEEIVAHHPDPWTRAVGLILKGHAMENAGDMTSVAPCYERAFELFGQIGERWGQAISLNSLGEIHEGNGEWELALSSYDRSLGYLLDLGTRDDVAMTLVRLARMRLLTGDRAGAEAALEQARDVCDRFAQPLQSVMVELGYAELARHDGDLAEAERLIRATQSEDGSAGGFGPYQVRAMMSSTLARVLVPIGKLDEARTVLTSALAFARRSRDVPVIADVFTVWATYALAVGDPAAAVTILGSTETMRGLALPPRGERADLATEARKALGQKAFDAAYAVGAGMDQNAGQAALMEWAGLTGEDLDTIVDA